MIPQFFDPIEIDCSPDMFNLDAVLQEDSPPTAANANSYLTVPNMYYSNSDSDAYASSDDSYSSAKKPKRRRRLSSQINRRYQCDFPGCQKSYEKVSHLNTHRLHKGHGQKLSKIELASCSGAC